MSAILDWLTSPTALGWIAFLAVAGYAILKERKPWIEKYGDMVVRAFNYAEKAIPDDTPNKSLQKLDAFFRAFKKSWLEKYGKTPSEDDIVQARDAAERLVYRKNAGGK
jgi:hypothetical protein